MPRTIVFMALAFFFMMFGLFIGILRLMSTTLFYTAALVEFFPLHSFIMVSGFLAAVIMTERVAGLESIPAAQHDISHRFMVPLTILGTIAGAAGYVAELVVLRYLGALLLVSGSIAFLLTLRFLRRSTESKLSFNFMMLSVVAFLVASAMSADRLAVGNLGLVMLLVSFPVLFILGERIELSRFTSNNSRTAKFDIAFLMAASCVILFGVAGAPLPFAMTGISFLLGSLLLLVVFVVVMTGESKTIGRLLSAKRPLQRYVATHVRVGYVWGMVGMLLALAFALSGFTLNLYDAFIHALTVGFVGTMMLGHGPVILPGLLKKSFAEDALSRLPLAVLSAAVVLRVFGEVLLLALGWNVLNLVVATSGWVVLGAVILFIRMIHRGINRSVVGGTRG